MQKNLKWAIPILVALITTAGIAMQQVDAYKRTVMIHITAGEADFHSATMGVEHAKSTLAAGKTVVVLLDVDGVALAAKNPPANLKTANQNLQEFLDSGGRVIACEHCIAMAGLKSTDLLPGVEIDKHPQMPKMQQILDDAAVVLDY
ncbi:MAG: DsrE family protein [Candidatus Nitrosotenuis sp.]